MSKESNNIPHTGAPDDQSVEYVFSSVPQDKRKKLLSLTVVLAGYPIALSNFVIGGKVGVGLTFPNAVLALLLGNVILITIVIITGLFAFKTGLSTSFLSRRVFGYSGSSIFSILLAVSAVTWVATNGDIFARMIPATFTWWPIPVSITAILVILMWMQSAIRGFDGLQIISYLGVPAAIIMAIVGVIFVLKQNSFESITSYVPTEPITIASATSQIVGGWIFGAVITPDVCRYAKKKSHVFISGIVAFVIGCFGLQFAGALVALCTGTGDFVVAMTGLGLGYVAFVCAVFCLWTTQDNNIYGASLALQNLFETTKYKGKFKHKHLAAFISGLAAILAFLGIYNYLSPVISVLSVLFPPLPGMIIAELLFVKSPQHERKTNPIALITWVIAGVVGYLALTFNFFIPPVLNILTAIIVYALLMKLFGPKSAQAE
ncbi:MAG: purine-cytosine permease family protein [Lachnospiraceae bacterium]